MSALTVRFAAKNGTDEITIDQIKNAKVIIRKKEFDIGEVFRIEEPEGGTLDKEILAQTVRQILVDNIYGPLSKDICKKIEEINEAWQEVKDKIEPLLQGKHAQCPVCGSHALTGTFADNEKFICPSCGTKLRWKLISNEGVEDQYILIR